jgi:hypothetical protein
MSPERPNPEDRTSPQEDIGTNRNDPETNERIKKILHPSDATSPAPAAAPVDDWRLSPDEKADGLTGVWQARDIAAAPPDEEE